MKKQLSVILSICIFLSNLVIPVSAAEQDKEDLQSKSHWEMTNVFEVKKPSFENYTFGEGYVGWKLGANYSEISVSAPEQKYKSEEEYELNVKVSNDVNFRAPIEFVGEFMKCGFCPESNIDMYNRIILETDLPLYDTYELVGDFSYDFGEKEDVVDDECVVAKSYEVVEEGTGKRISRTKNVSKSIMRGNFPEIKKLGEKIYFTIGIPSGINVEDPNVDESDIHYGMKAQLWHKTVYEYTAVKNKNVGFMESKDEDDRPEEDSGIRFNDIWGEVSVRPDDEVDEAYEYAEFSTVLHWLDRIRTKDESGCVLGFLDRSTLALKENTIIVLPPEKEAENKFITLAGKTWVNLKKMVKGENMQFETSQAVCGIKGTQIIVEVDPNTQESNFFLLTHAAVVHNKQTGENILLTAGQCASVLGEKTSVETFDVEEKIKEYPAEECKEFLDAYNNESNDDWKMPEDMEDMKLEASDFDFSEIENQPEEIKESNNKSFLPIGIGVVIVIAVVAFMAMKKKK